MRDAGRKGWFKRNVSLTFWLIVTVVSLMWIATLLDVAFGFGWGWDRRGLIAAPVILAIAVIVRVWHGVVDRLLRRLAIKQ
jgi:hypothetical protein